MKQEDDSAMLATGHGHHGGHHMQGGTFALARSQGQMQLPWGTEGEIAGSKGNGTGSKADSPRVSRSQRACDACRRKKVRCTTALMSIPREDEFDVILPDGTRAESPGSAFARAMEGRPRCATCTAASIPCVFTRTPAKRGPNKGYIQQLEHRLAALESTVVSAPGTEEGIDGQVASEGASANESLDSINQLSASRSFSPPYKRARTRSDASNALMSDISGSSSRDESGFRLNGSVTISNSRPNGLVAPVGGLPAISAAPQPFSSMGSQRDGSAYLRQATGGPPGPGLYSYPYHANAGSFGPVGRHRGDSTASSTASYSHGYPVARLGGHDAAQNDSDYRASPVHSARPSQSSSRAPSPRGSVQMPKSSSTELSTLPYGSEGSSRYRAASTSTSTSSAPQPKRATLPSISNLLSGVPEFHSTSTVDGARSGEQHRADHRRESRPPTATDASAPAKQSRTYGSEIEVASDPHLHRVDGSANSFAIPGAQPHQRDGFASRHARPPTGDLQRADGRTAATYSRTEASRVPLTSDPLHTGDASRVHLERHNYHSAKQPNGDGGPRLDAQISESSPLGSSWSTTKVNGATSLSHPQPNSRPSTGTHAPAHPTVERSEDRRHMASRNVSSYRPAVSQTLQSRTSPQHTSSFSPPSKGRSGPLNGSVLAATSQQSSARSSPFGASLLGCLDKSAVMSLDSPALRTALFSTPAMRTFSLLTPARLRKGLGESPLLIKAAYLLTASSATLSFNYDTIDDTQWQSDISEILGQCMTPMLFSPVGDEKVYLEIETLVLCYVDAIRRSRLLPGILGAISGKLAVVETRNPLCRRYQGVTLLLSVWHTVAFSNRRMYFGTPDISDPVKLFQAFESADPILELICSFTCSLERMCRRYCDKGEAYVSLDTLELVTLQDSKDASIRQRSLLSVLNSYLHSLNFMYNQNGQDSLALEELEKQARHLHHIVNEMDSSGASQLLVGPHVSAMAACATIYCLALARELLAEAAAQSGDDRTLRLQSLQREFLSILDTIKQIAQTLAAPPEASLINSHAFADGGDMRLLYSSITRYVEIHLAAAMLQGTKQHHQNNQQQADSHAQQKQPRNPLAEVLASKTVLRNLHQWGYLGAVFALTQRHESNPLL